MAGGALGGALLILGAAILAGYVGGWLFRRFRVSDILLLLVVGFVLGPALGWLDASVLAPAMPILGPLGLMIILFEGGLELRWDDLRRHGAGALGFTLLTWTLTTGSIALVAHEMLALSWPLALLLGCAVGATGIVAVIPILAQVKAPPKARVWLTVETGIGDLLSAVGVTALSAYLLAGGGAADFGSVLVARFALGGAVGFLVGLAWARILHHVHARSHAYALTLGALFVAYAATEALGGSGYLCALVFGLIVGNAPALMREGGVPALAGLGERSRQHQHEVIFLLRSVYFVFLGMSVDRGLLSAPTGRAILALTAALVAARLVSVLATHRVRSADDARTRVLLAGMMPRAMAAAVLATIPAAMGVPGAQALVPATLMVIVGADVATTCALYAYERKRARAAPEIAAVAAAR